MINQECLKSLSLAVCGEEDVNFLRELVDLFHEQTPLQLQKIVRGIETSNFDEISRAAHMLKSSCAFLGAAEMASDCQELELLSTKQIEFASRERAIALLQHLQVSFEQSSQELRSTLEQLSMAGQTRH
jgi:HPt (histidine-containing phosphotransfer) domain-containing protein